MALLHDYRAEAEAEAAPSRAARPFGGRLKRVFDIAFAAAVLAFVAPLMLAIVLAVKAQDHGPVFFVQTRVGLGGRLFRCLKFRSMVLDAEARMQALLLADPVAAREWAEKQKITNDPRVTPVGRFLRRTSLDELPQFINVLTGDMSIVGPRPMLLQQVGDYGVGFARYCAARPGITGLWQVSGRNETSFRRRSELDQHYLARWSFLADLKLVWRTVFVVFAQRGAC